MIAHLLTAFRFALALPLAAAFAHPELLDRGPLAVYLAVALATDYFDGVIARRYGTASAGGQLFDHATDCFFVTTCLTGAAFGGHVPLLLPVLIAVAFLQYAVDSYWIHRQARLRIEPDRPVEWHRLLRPARGPGDRPPGPRTRHDTTPGGTSPAGSPGC